MIDDRCCNSTRINVATPHAKKTSQTSSQKAKPALHDLCQIVETLIPDDMELDDYGKSARLRIYLEGSEGGGEHNDNLSGGELSF